MATQKIYLGATICREFNNLYSIFNVSSSLSFSLSLSLFSCITENEDFVCRHNIKIVLKKNSR